MIERNLPREVIIVDDVAADLQLAQEAAAESGAKVTLTFAHGGQEALAILRERVAQSGQRQPALVLMDLNMPIWDGETTLSHIRADRNVCLTPVVMFTTSRSERDVERAYAAGANGYICKPIDFTELVEFFGRLDAFWASHVVPPRMPPKVQPSWQAGASGK